MLCLRRAAIAAAAIALIAVGAAGARAQTPAPAQAAPAEPAQPAPEARDPFGEDVTLAEKTIIFMRGSANWDAAFDTLVDTFKTLSGFLDKQGIKPAGPAMTIYTATDDTGFQFQAAYPIEAAPANLPPGDIEVGKSPTGKALKFVHRGSYDAMDVTYDAITNLLDEKKLEARDLFIEQYQTDPITVEADKLVIEVYVPVK